MINRYLVADFETTTAAVSSKESQVWSAAYADLDMPCEPGFVNVLPTIDLFMKEILSQKQNTVIYFHNLKFDGTFILDWLKRQKKWKQDGHESAGRYFWTKDLQEMEGSSYQYCVSTMGQWYSITLKKYNKIYQFRDSLKLLPFTLKKIGKDFGTKYQKLEMDYDRKPGEPVTAEEIAYIKNDILVLHEAMNIMRSEGHDRLTIGSCCLHEFKRGYSKEDYRNLFPDLTQDSVRIHGTMPDDYNNPDEYIRRAYHGGWCYLKPDYAGKVITGHGCTYDFNSMYPSMMHSDSGNMYPIGLPYFFKGKPDDKYKTDKYYYFLRFKCRFNLKKGKLPTVQIKDSFLYKPNEWQTTSDYTDTKGNVHPHRVILTMTCRDFELFTEHYKVTELEFLDGCVFRTAKGLFDQYIDKWAKLKVISKGAQRQICKLFLNNLYGKMAASDDSSFKLFYLNDAGVLCSKVSIEHNKEPGYIPIGAAITSYARCTAIRAAQANYKYFIYADTDSIHCKCKPDKIKNISIHPTAFQNWALESEWDEAIFQRQKTYIEHIVAEDGEPIASPYYNVKAAGMPAKAKKILQEALEGRRYTDSTERNFYSEPGEGRRKLYIARNGKELDTVTISDFCPGLECEGNLKARIVKGGTILFPNNFQMR